MEKKNKLIFIITSSILSAIIIFLAGFFIADIVRKDKRKDRFEEIYSIIKKYHYSEPTDDQLYIGAIEGMFNALGDRFSYGEGDPLLGVTISPSYKEETAYYWGLGISIYLDIEGNVTIENVYRDSPAYKAGIRPFDCITMINDKSVDGYTMSQIEKILGDKSTSEDTKLTLKRGDDQYSVEVRSGIVFYDDVSSEVIDGVGYLRISNFVDNSIYSTVKAHLESLEEKNISKLIIDVRNNPGGAVNVVNKVLSLFTYPKNSEYCFSLEGYIIEDNKPKYDELYFEPNKDGVKKEYDINVLVDGLTASAAEIFAAVMGDYLGYTVIGEATYGKNIYQNSITVSKYYAVKLTLGYWYYYDADGNKKSVGGSGYEPSIALEAGIYNNLLYPNITTSVTVDTVCIPLIDVQKLFCSLGYDVRTDGYYDEKMVIATLAIKKRLVDEFGRDLALTKEIDKDFVYYLWYDLYNPLQEKHQFDDVLHDAIKG